MCGIHLAYNCDQFKTIRHRGIEHRVYYVEDILMQACHSRLPIQTLEGDDNSQPIIYDDGSVLMFNGEVFNFPEKYDCDIQYLKSFFAERNTFDKLTSIESIDEIKKWDGFWSIVYIGMQDKSVTTFTDPLGKKQLYINQTGEISSEIKSLIPDEFDIDPIFISSVRKWGYNKDDRTPYQGIRRLIPNNIYSFPFARVGVNPKKFRVYKEYYDFFGYYFVDPKEALFELLKDSVDNRLITKKYPIAMLLSGGLDSTIITYFLEKVFGANVKYYSIRNQEDDEHVKICQDYFGIEVKFLEYDMHSDQELIDQIYYMNDYPIDLGSVVPQWHLFKAIANQTDCKIVISGDGADEMFGGYRRINEYDSQGSDLFEELTYYHLPRLDRMSMAHTLELRSPFLRHELAQLAVGLPFEQRKNKAILKETFKGEIPDQVIYRKKLPLKNPLIVDDKIKYRNQIVDRFVDNPQRVWSA